MDLNTAGRDLPEELEDSSFKCLAFPQDTLMARLIVVLIMVRATRVFSMNILPLLPSVASSAIDHPS
jgi:hypothetical protein